MHDPVKKMISLDFGFDRDAFLNTLGMFAIRRPCVN